VENEWRRFRHQIAPLGSIPFYAVPGNHDVFNGERQVDPRLEGLFEDQWGALYYRFRYGNAAFFVLNSDSSLVQNGIDPAQLRWLSEVLKGEQATHKFVFLHRPPRFLKEADALHDLFVLHGVDYVVYGHHHHYHHEHRDGVHYVMTNNSGTSAVPHPELGNFNHLLQVAVRDDEVSVASIGVDAIRPLDFVTPRDNYDYFALTRGLTEDQVQAEPVGQFRYRFTLTLKNPTDRALETYIACTSADHRWLFSPQAVPMVRIEPRAAESIEIETRYEPNRVPEAEPSCLIEIPYQSSAGNWLRFEKPLTISTASPGEEN
jgi:predicted phosphodiesterase